MSELERVTIAKNVATNGRLFCVLLFVLCIAVYLVKQDHFYVLLAIQAASPIGLSHLSERTGSDRLNRCVSGASVGLITVVIGALLITA